MGESQDTQIDKTMSSVTMWLGGGAKALSAVYFANFPTVKLMAKPKITQELSRDKFVDTRLSLPKSRKQSR